MKTKRQLHHYWTRLRPFNPWSFFLLALLFLFLGIFFLRQNNLTALGLRDRVLAADKADGDVEGALRELRTYVHSHMNTNLAAGSTAIKPAIQLKYRYERLVKAEKERVSKRNQQIYTEAQINCERRFPAGLGGAGRIPCIENYVSKNGIKAQPIHDALYKFDFVSPRWALDRAGISLAVAALLLILFAVRLSLEIWLKKRFE